jgi:type I restriction enzyme S subunit
MREPNETRTLGDLLDAGLIEATNGFPFGGHNDSNEGIPHIRPFNVRPDGVISLNQIKSIPIDAASGRPRLARDDIVFNNTNTKELVGKCASWESDDDHVFSNHMTRIRIVDPTIIPAYLSFSIFHHWLIGKSEMLARAHVAQASIMGERFREIEIVWREAIEQLRISDLLNLVLRARQNQEHQIENANHLKRTAMYQLLTHGLRGEAQKETDIGLVPKGWNCEPLGRFAEIVYGAQAAVANATDASIGTLILTNVNLDLDGNINLDKKRYYKIPENHRDRLTLLRGDVLFNWRSGSADHVGKTVYFDLDGEYTFSSFILRFRPHRSVSSKFLFRWLTHLRVNGYFNSQRNVSSINSVYNASLSATIPVWFPEKREQDEIVAVLDALDQKIALHRRKQVVLDGLFKTLLHKLIIGEIRVADFDFSALGTALIEGAAA